MKEKYAHLPLELRNKVMLIDIGAYLSGEITLEELRYREYPLDKREPKAGGILSHYTALMLATATWLLAVCLSLAVGAFLAVLFLWGASR